MSRIVQTVVYKFDELDERAKERAREWYRCACDGDLFWSESVIEDAATIADLIGLDLRQRAARLMGGGTRMEPTIYWSGFSSQGDGACFEGNWTVRADAVAKLHTHADQDERLTAIARTIEQVSEMTRGLLVAVIRHRGTYSHEHTMSFEFEYPDEDEDSTLSNETKGEAEELLTEAARDFARWIYRTLEREYDWQNADEQVDETIRANEYEFDAEGRRA